MIILELFSWIENKSGSLALQVGRKGAAYIGLEIRVGRKGAEYIGLEIRVGRKGAAYICLKRIQVAVLTATPGTAV
ncbi:MAG: hypothetical protein M0R69_03460 [Candidatus Cloacimonetes bacterium]|jgi:hypothetical protein|nr:hypothetical protein [Candidatus Cloacimonadota bacterium]